MKWYKITIGEYVVRNFFFSLFNTLKLKSQYKFTIDYFLVIYTHKQAYSKTGFRGSLDYYFCIDYADFKKNQQPVDILPKVNKNVAK